MKKKVLLFYFGLLQIFFALYANPFTGNKNSPSQVKQGHPSAGIVKNQRLLNEKLGKYIYDWKENKNFSIFFTVLGISFLYGVIHAAGPGHRKSVIFSFYLAKTAKPLEPLFTSLGLAGVHGGTAIIIMFIFKGISGAVLANSNNTTVYMEGLSFILLIIFSIYGLIDAVLDLVKWKCEKHQRLKLGAIMLSGMYPCPAAMLILVLALSLDVLFLGFFAVLVLSLGMSVPIITCAYLAWAGRSGLFYKLKNKEKYASIMGGVLQISGYGVLLFISVDTAMPFILSLFKLL